MNAASAWLGQRWVSPQKIIVRRARTLCASPRQPCAYVPFTASYPSLHEVSSLPRRTSSTPDRSSSECAVIPSPDSTLSAVLESMKRIQRAALYARVSTDAQKQEGEPSCGVETADRRRSPRLLTAKTTSTIPIQVDAEHAVRFCRV